MTISPQTPPATLDSQSQFGLFRLFLIVTTISVVVYGLIFYIRKDTIFEYAPDNTWVYPLHFTAFFICFIISLLRQKQKDFYEPADVFIAFLLALPISIFLIALIGIPVQGITII